MKFLVKINDIDEILIPISKDINRGEFIYKDRNNIEHKFKCELYPGDIIISKNIYKIIKEIS